MTALTARAWTIPTDHASADGTLEWNETTLVVVFAEAGDARGLGWTYGPAAVVDLVSGKLAGVVAEVSPLDVPRAHEEMCRTVRNAGREGVCGLAISAVDCALWDLKARLLGTPLHALLGRARDSVPIYGSGGLTSYSDELLCEQVESWSGRGITRMKIKIGESRGAREDRDLSRLALVRRTAGDGVELFADANGGYGVKQAVRVARRAADLDLRWFEEPVSSDDRAGLREVADAVAPEVAAGEYGFTPGYLARLLPSVDCLQVDVTRCGGITDFLRAAGTAAALNRDVSAHCAPAQHVAVMAALPNARHIEYFHDHVRIERMAFDGVPDPVEGNLPAAGDAPGNGLTLRERDLGSFRVR